MSLIEHYKNHFMPQMRHCQQINKQAQWACRRTP